MSQYQDFERVNHSAVVNSLSVLQLALLANGTFSGSSGFAVIFFAPWLNQLLGTASYLPNSLVVALGGMLVVYGVLLFFLAMQQRIWFSWVTVAIILDFGWVAGSSLIALGGEFLSLAGRKLIIGVAIIVAVLALMQYIGLRRYAINCEAKEFSMSTLRAIGASWLSMKLWVKIWLFFLNFVFIAALAFLGDDPAIVWILISYVGSGPYLVAFMVPQRGLSRLLGLAHIVPWTPLMAYLACRLVGAGPLEPQITAVAQPQIQAYILILMFTTGICLAFDYYDVVRWLRGERFILGTAEAYRHGASGLAR